MIAIFFCITGIMQKQQSAGKKYTLSPGVSVDRDVLIPICEKSEGNCCKKSWLDSSIRYL